MLMVVCQTENACRRQGNGIGHKRPLHTHSVLFSLACGNNKLYMLLGGPTNPQGYNAIRLIVEFADQVRICLAKEKIVAMIFRGVIFRQIQTHVDIDIVCL